MMPSLQIGSLTLQTPLILAPMAGYTDTAFRSAVREQGGLGLAVTEMINPRSAMHGGGLRRTALLTRRPADHPLSWQLYGSDPDILAEGARYLVDRCHAEMIDLNMGCPQRKIAGRGDGAALLKTPELAVRIATAVVNAVNVPVSAKIRIGWDNQHVVAPRLAVMLAESGIQAVSVHGRTALQKYSGTADWSAIRAVVAALDGRIPVIANGDVQSTDDARRLVDDTGCAGIMIGRAALKNPWIFRQLTDSLRYGRTLPPVSKAQRRAFLIDLLGRTGELYGESNAVKMFRKWIPQHAAALDIAKPDMVRIMQLRDPVALTDALHG